MTAFPQLCIGLDFGTTNTVLSWRIGDDPVQSWQLNYDGASHDTYRSALYVESGPPLQSWAGPAALAEYRAYGTGAMGGDGGGRLLQSLKSHLASPHMTGTVLFGKSFTLSQLIAMFLRCLRQDAATLPQGLLSGTIHVGRPVRFVGAAADETLALDRLREAFANAGMHKIVFVAEPIAAAYAYAQRTDRAARVLIADLGGGTTDYAIVDIIQPGATPQLAVVATGGVSVAGDDLDAVLIERIVAPRLGRDAVLRNGQGNEMAPPRWLYDHLRRWHHLSFLKTQANQTLLRQLIGEAVTTADRAALTAFAALVDTNQGFALAQAITDLKRKLSSEQSVDFRFVIDGYEIAATVTRQDFAGWIAPVLARMGDGLQVTLAHAGDPAIDQVFLTGGTSFVPAVHDLFRSALPAATIHRGNELTSVSAGLALQAN